MNVQSMTHPIRILSIVLALLVLAACGGGGGGGATPKVWGTAALIETDDAGSAYSPQIAFDASGNALAVWQLLGAISATSFGHSVVSTRPFRIRRHGLKMKT